MRQAGALLELNPPRITEKKKVPPSGDKHDYYSIGIYWWPNPLNGGLPYFYCDGVRNPEADQYDGTTLRLFADQVGVLAQAFLITGEARYAEKAKEYLRVWFLDKETRMNPHLCYAQAVPGWVDGTPTGILEGGSAHEKCSGRGGNTPP